MRATCILATILLTGALTPALSSDLTAGQTTFERYCASCHGLEANGHGPMRPVLRVAPADLTRLSAQNNGAFPLERVIHRIDGRDPLVSHGSPMPVYGDFFDLGKPASLQTESGQSISTTQPVADLVTYLKHLQTGQN